MSYGFSSPNSSPPNSYPPDPDDFNPLEQLPPPAQGDAPNRPKRTRSFFLPTFLFTFLLWSMVSCGGVAAMVGLGDLRLSNFQPSPPLWTPPPPATFTPALADSQEGDEQAAAVDGQPAQARFQPGVQVRNVTNSRVNIRQSPGYLSKPGSDIIAQINPGESVEILGWPRSVDSLAWWPIRYSAEGSPVEGWVAEATAAGVQILAPAE
jgi:hypothetical protein